MPSSGAAQGDRIRHDLRGVAGSLVSGLFHACPPAQHQQEYELRIYRHIIPALGEIPLNKLTEANLQQFYHQLKHDGRLNRTDLYGPGLSDRSVRGCHITCRAALAQAVEEGPIPVNPAEGCKLPGEGRREMQVLTREEMQRLLIQAKEDGCYELLLLELSAGLRRGELLAL